MANDDEQQSIQAKNKLKELNAKISRLQEENELLQKKAELIEWGRDTALWEWDPNTDIVRYFDKYAVMLGYIPEDLGPYFKSFLGIVHPKDCEQTYNRMLDLLHGSIKTLEAEFRVKSKDGKWYWFYMTSKVTQRDKNNNPLKVTGIFKDITILKHSKNEPRRSAKQYRQLFDSMREGFAIHRIVEDEKGKPVDYIFLEVNKAFEDLTGLKRKNIIGKMVTEVLPGIQNDPADWIGKYGKVAQKGKEVRFEYYSEPLDQWYSVLAYQTQKNEFATLFENVTKRKMMEEARQKSEEKFRTIFNYAADGIIYIDRYKAKVLDVNPAFTEITGVTRKEMINESAYRLIENFFSDNSERLNEILDQLSKGQDIPPYEINYKGKNLEITTKSRDDDFETVGIVRDITDRKKFENEILKAKESAEKAEKKLRKQNIKLEHAEKDLKESYEKLKDLNTQLEEQYEELEISKEKAEESDRLKSAFLANMSHEIRTPMNGILGFSRLLKQPGISEEMRDQYITIIEESGDRLVNIVDNLIDISKIESGQMEVVEQETNLNEQLEYLYNLFKPKTDEKGLLLKYTSGLKYPKATIQTDQDKFIAVFTNLLENAEKYTNEGQVEFGYSLKNDKLEFYVKDTGIGIPEERQQVVFDRFVQAEMHLARKYEGAGIGLSITKSYVEMLGGKIWLESTEGKGSAFYFTLPYTKGAETTVKNGQENASSLEKMDLSQATLLITEDDETAQSYLTELLRDSCKRILHAGNGAEAVRICRQMKDIDVILMDIKMPEMNGDIATQKIREFNKDVIIIAQTAYAMIGDREMAITSGCNDYIKKPVDPEELFATLEKHLG